MTETVTLSALSKLEVTLADGRVFEVQTANPDYVRMDLTFSKEKWPTMTEGGPFLALTFLAWSAAKRLGLYDGKWEDWSNTDCLQVVDEETDEDVDPTQPKAPSEPASSSQPHSEADPSTGSTQTTD